MNPDVLCDAVTVSSVLLGIFLYCVRGGSVSRSVQEKLREQQVKVRFVAGGLEAWK